MIKCEDPKRIPKEEENEENTQEGDLFEIENVSSVSSANAGMSAIGRAKVVDENFATDSYMGHLFYHLQIDI